MHFRFQDRKGRQYVIEHRKHFLRVVGEGDRLQWTAANDRVSEGVPNIRAELKFPMYVDSMPNNTLIVSDFESSCLYRPDPDGIEAVLFVDGLERPS
jgi:hypothetical protein